MVNQSANEIIANALKEAGVQTKDIELPAEPVAESASQVPSLDGKPKGQTKGDNLETEEPEPEAKAESSETEFDDEKVTQPLTKAEIEAAITETTSRIQSLTDRKINQINYQIQQQSKALNQFFKLQEDASIAGLAPEEQTERRLDRLEKGGGQAQIQIPDQPIDQAPSQFYQQLVNFVDTVGLKVDDPRIDWARDTNDGKAGFNRFLVSVRKCITDDQKKLVDEVKETGAREIKKLRKQTGVDKVGNHGPGGIGSPNVDGLTAMQKIELGFKLQDELSQDAK